MHNNELYENVRTRDYCAITAKVKGERVSRSAHTTIHSKLVRLRYAWYYRIKSPSGPSSVLAALGTPQPSFWTSNAVEPRLTLVWRCRPFPDRDVS